ncbi:aspartyl protease family protein [Cryomorphaceae bacterium]|nr:aspartyl protease family protein [Cryomorphaceae bacterium]
MKQVRFLFFAVLIFALTGGCGVSKNARLRDSTKAPQEAFVDSIPFTWKYQSIVIQIHVPGAGRPWDMIFDTGASYTVLNQTNVQTISIRQVSSVSIGDTHGRRQSTPVFLLDSVRLGSTTFTHHAAVGVPYSENSILRCVAADGILGANLMKKLHWKIDYQRQMIYFASERQLLPPAPNDEGIQSFKYIGSRPHITLDINGYEVSNVLMDTGYNGFMDGSPKLVNTLKDSNGVWSYYRKFDGTTFGLYGVAQDTLYLSPENQLTLADGSIWSYEMEIQRGSGAKIGNDLFRHYDLYFFFPDDQVQWVAIDTVRHMPSEPGFGLGMILTNKGVEVRSITEGGPADQAGIQLGDVVERVNQIPIAEFKGRNCDFYDYIRSFSDDQTTLKLGLREKGNFELEKAYFPVITSKPSEP